jgi:hypothetical protein
MNDRTSRIIASTSGGPTCTFTLAFDGGSQPDTGSPLVYVLPETDQEGLQTAAEEVAYRRFADAIYELRGALVDLESGSTFHSPKVPKKNPPNGG